MRDTPLFGSFDKGLLIGIGICVAFQTLAIVLTGLETGYWLWPWWMR
jgi:hypothetical protein